MPPEVWPVPLGQALTLDQSPPPLLRLQSSLVVSVRGDGEFSII